MKRWFNKPARKAPVAQQATARPTAMPMMLALEPRIMFDAAAAATAVDVTHHEATHDAAQDAAQAAAVAAPPAAAPSPAPEAAVAPAPAPPPAAAEASAGSNTVVFVDARVQDASSLLQGVAADAQVVQLQEGHDGLQQMADYLAAHPGASSVQVIAHGNDGDLWLGSTYLSGDTVASHAAQLAAIGSGIQQGGDILIYACDTAAGDQGLGFVNSLASLIGRDVAASDDRTGARGDWDLEVSVGSIEAVPALALSAEAGYAHDLAIITVTSNADSGAGSLRNAIASATAGDTITFNAGMTVTLSSGQLTIGKNLTIDGDLDNNGTADVTIDANYTSRVMSVSAGQTVNLDGLVLTHGLLAGNGGAGGSSASTTATLGAGISNAGTLTLTNVTVTGNSAAGGGGGGGVAGGYVGGGGGGGGGIGGGIGGTGGSTGPGTGTYAGVAGSANTGGRGGGYNAVDMGGRGGTSSGGAGGNGTFGYTDGGNGGTASNGSISIGGGGGGAGWNATGGVGGAAAGGIYNASTGTITIIGTSIISNNLGAGGGGGGGAAAGSSSSQSGGTGGVGVGGIYNNGGLVQMTAANFAAMTGNAGGGGSGGIATGGGSNGATGTASNNITTVGGGTTNTNYNPNATPAIGNLGGDSVAWAGVGSTVVLDASTNASLTDAELGALNAGNGNWSGASLAVQRSGTAVSADTFGFNTSGAAFTVSGSNLQAGGLTFATFTNTGGVLTVTFTSSGTAATTALVNDVAQRITYRSDTPAGDATVRFTLSDGTSSTTADVTVTSDTIYVTNTADTATLNVSNGVSFSEAVAIAAADATGSQTLVLSSSLASQTVTLAGALAVNESLTVNGDAANLLTLSGSTITLGGGTTLAFTNSSGTTVTVASALAGSGALSKAGAGTLALTSTSNESGMSGGITVTAGTLQVSNDDHLSSGTLTLNGGTLTNNVTAFTIDNAIVLGVSGGTIDVGGGGGATQLTVSGVISGSGNLTKTSAAILVLSGNNTYTGSTLVQAGTLIAAHNNALGTTAGATTVANGASLRVNGGLTVSEALTLSGIGRTVSAVDYGALHLVSGSSTVSGNVTLAADTNVSAASGSTLTLSGAMSGASGLNKTDAGTLTLSNTGNEASFTGGTTVTAGTLSISSDDHLGAGTVTLAGGTLSVSSTLVLDNAIDLAADSTLHAGADFTQSGVVSGSGGLTKTGSGTLTLTGTNTFTGATSINAGSLAVSNSSALGTSAGGTTVADGASLVLSAGVTIADALSITGTGAGAAGAIHAQSGSSTVSGAVTLTGHATINVDSGAGLTLAGGLGDGVGTFNLTKGQAGTLTLAGTASYDGSTTVNAGTLSIGADSHLGSGTLTLAAGTTLDVTGATTIDNAVTLSGNATVQAASAVTFSGAVSGAGGLTKTGAGTLTLAGSNGFTGNVDLSAGGLTLSGGSAVDDGSALAMSSGTTLTLSASEAVGSLSGTGTVALGANTLTSGGNGTSTSFSGNIGGTGALIKAGAGTLTLSGTNTYTGATTVSAGTVQVQNGAAIGDDSAVSVASGAFLVLSAAEAIGSLAGAGTVTLGANTLTTGGNNGSTTFSGTVAGSGGVVKNGSGTLTLSGTNTYTGATSVTAGTLALNGGGAMSDNSALTVSSGATLALGASETIGSLAGTGDVSLGSFTLTSGGDNTSTSFSGALSGSGGLIKAGSGTLTLSGAGNSSTFTGGTTVAAGTLSIGADSHLGSGTLTLAAGTTLAVTGVTTIDNAVTLSGNSTIDTAASTTLSGAITGAGGLTKTGAATLTLSATNGFTGSTTVSAGTLLVNGALSATSGVTVGTGATLGGTGSLFAAASTNTLTVQNGGTLSPGTSPGTITIHGNLTMAAGSTLAVEINGTTAGTQYDQVVVNGTVNVTDAALSATHGYTAGNADTYTIIVNDAADAVTGTFSGLSEGGTLTAGGNGTVLTASYVGGSSNDVTLSSPAFPVVTSVSSSSPNGTYRIGDTIAVTVTFDVAVTVDTTGGTPTLQLETGSTDRTLSYASGSGTSTLTFNYTVQAGDTSADLDYVSTSALALNGSTIRDALGHDASLTLATPGAANSLGANNAIVVDGVRPTAGIVVADTALAAGETSLVTITFNEAVTGFTNADLTVANGTLSAVSSADGGVTWTATFTPTASITDTTNVITLDNSGVTDAAGNTGTGTTDSNNYAIDTARPTGTIVVADAALAAGETSLVTITFSEAVTGFTTADLTVANGALSGLSSSDGGTTWTATFTPTANVTDTSNVITLDNTGVQDAAGNTGAGTTDSNNYAIDTARPTATVVVADASLATGETSLVTITFSEAVTGFTNADLTVVNGTLSAVSSADGGITWTATFTPTANVTDTSNVITLDNTGVVDAAGNTGTGTTDSNNYAIDTARPTASIVVADAALAAGETSLVTITFSEAVTGFTNTDLTVVNGTLSAVSSADGGVTWTATFTPTASVTDTSNVVTLDNTGVQDAAGNAGTGTTDSNNYAIDTQRPTASIAVADTALSAGETSLVTITFSEAVTGLTTTDFTVANGALSGLASSDGGITWTATLTPTASVTDTSNVITLDNTGVQDAAGNAGTGTTDSNNYAIDTARPTATIVVADTSLAASETSTVSVTFSEAVTGLTSADFSVANGTLSGLSSSDGGVTWTATLTPTADVTDTSNLVTLDNTGVADAAGNTGTGTTDSNNYAIDTARPTATIVVADTSLAAGETSLVTITFSEAVTGFTNADLTIANGTLSAVSSSDGGITWTATFTPTTNVTDTSNLITLDNTGVTDAAGNAGTGTTDSNNYAIDTVRPTASIVVADAALAAGETSLVTITFSEAVTGFTTADLTVANGALSGLSSSDGGTTWTATLTPTADVADTSNLITLDNTGVADAAGNTGTGTTDSNNYAIDTARPTATIVVADTALAAGETSAVTITFSEAVSGLTSADLTVANGVVSGLSSADGGLTWTGTLTPNAGVTDTTNVVTLDDTGVLDAAGNAGTGTTDSNNYAIDTQRPTASIVVADTSLAAGETSLVTITFSEAVSGFTNADLTVANGTLSAVTSSDGGITWTATFTPTASVTDTTNVITLDNTGVLDASGNTGAGTTDSNNYAIDTQRPTASIVVADTSLTVGESSLVTITFDEAVTGLTTADFTVANGALSGLISSDGGITWTATLTPTANVTDTTNLVTLDNTGVQDAAGNAGTGTTDSNNYAVDTAQPTATIVVADTSLAAGETSLVTVTFSEAVTGFTNADLTVANGTLSAVTSSDGGITWTATLTPTANVADTSNVITLANTGVQDSAGNTGTGITDSNNYAIDTARPTATIVVADAALAAGETSLVTITFSEAVTGLTTADLTVANGVLSGLASSDGGLTWTATLTPTANVTDATNLITLANTGVQDSAGNAGTGTTDSNNYAVDTTVPVVTSVAAPANGTYVAGQNLDFTVNMSEAVTVDTSGGTPRIAVTLDTGGTVFASYLAGSGTSALTFRLTVAAGQLDGNGVTVATSIDLDGATLRDAAGNDAATALNNVGATAGVRIDGIAPAVTTVAVPPAGLYNAGDVLGFTVNTGEAVVVDPAGGTPRLALDMGGRTVFASYVSGSGTTALQFQYTVQPGDNDADGVAVTALQANGGTLRDAAGNDLALALDGVASTAGVIVDTAAPVASGIVRVDATPTLASSVRYTVTFSEAVSGLDASDFVLTTTGTVTGSIVSVTQVDAQTYTVLVGGLGGQGLLGLDLDASGSGIVDAAGNAIAAGLEGQRYELRPIVVVPPVAPLPPAEPPAAPPVVVAPPAPPVTLSPLDPISPVTTPTLTPTGAPSGQGLVVIAGNPFNPDALAAPTLAPPAVAPAEGRAGFVEIGAASGAGLQAMPDIGDFNVQAGQPVNIALPASTFSHSERNVQVSVEVRLTDGRPLPSWLKFDPVSGTLSGQPPRGLNQKLSIEVIARDNKGNRATSHMDIEVKGAPASRDAPAPKPAPGSRSLLIDPTGMPSDLATALADFTEQAPRHAPGGRAGLAEQFELHGAAAREAERTALLEHARAAARSTG